MNQQQVNQTMLSNNGTETPPVICTYPLLFQLGALSVEGQNATMLHGICPDSIFVPIISWPEFFIYSVVAIITFSGLIWKRKSIHIEKRGFANLVAILLATSVNTLIPLLRWAGNTFRVAFIFLQSCFSLPQRVFPISLNALNCMQDILYIR